MDPRPATVPDGGAWTVTARHSQAVLKQHPIPFRKNPNAVSTTGTDLTVDSAHFASLLGLGCSEATIGYAIMRQRAHQDQDSFTHNWSRAFTTYLAMATQATSLWGCSSM
eukprot:3023946-Rhodomonas_salina.1